MVQVLEYKPKYKAYYSTEYMSIPPVDKYFYYYTSITLYYTVVPVQVP